MADVKLVIKIPEELLSEIDDENYQSTISWYDTTLYCAIKDGIPLPKGHGDIVDMETLMEMFWDGNSMEITKYDLSVIEPIIEADKTESEDKK